MKIEKFSQDKISKFGKYIIMHHEKTFDL